MHTGVWKFQNLHLNLATVYAHCILCACVCTLCSVRCSAQSVNTVQQCSVRCCSYFCNGVHKSEMCIKQGVLEHSENYVVMCVIYFASYSVHTLQFWVCTRQCVQCRLKTGQCMYRFADRALTPPNLQLALTALSSSHLFVNRLLLHLEDVD